MLPGQDWQSENLHLTGHCQKAEISEGNADQDFQGSNQPSVGYQWVKTGERRSASQERPREVG